MPLGRGVREATGPSGTVPGRSTLTRIKTMTQSASKLQQRIERELADDIDEEFEMELDDDRLDKLLADADDHQPGEGLDRRIYFKELLRLQGELIKLQDWVASNKQKVVVLF
jgi:polyphosphate kinase 2 (PPK2 family)